MPISLILGTTTEDEFVEKLTIALKNRTRLSLDPSTWMIAKVTVVRLGADGLRLLYLPREISSQEDALAVGCLP